MSYIEVEKKGSGGFATVFRVEESTTGISYAKKVYNPQQNIVDAVGDEHLKKRFKREVNYQSNLNHPNIVAIHESFLSEEPPYFIMPLADCTLKDELNIDATLGGNPRKALFDILTGLAVLHEEGYVHRDLKPENVLKFNDEKEVRYALSDFGLVSGVNSESSTLTGTNANGGTPNYAAPELIGGFKKATALADIYSFGVILHDIFGNGANRVPYTELTVPGNIGDIVKKCTKKLPIRRYKDIPSLREALYGVLNTDKLVFNSSNEEALVEILLSGEKLSDEQWDNVFIQLEDDSGDVGKTRNIMRSISDKHVEQLSEDAPELFSGLGEYYVDYIQEGTFNYEYCDVLADRGKLFYDLGGLQLKAKIAVALLELGVNYNRWYVEWKFIKMAGESIPDALANRIKVELEVQGINFNSLATRLIGSIGVTSSHFHPTLKQLMSGS